MRKIGGKFAGALVGLVILTLIGPIACRRGPQPSPELQSLLATDTLDRQLGDATVRAAVRAFYTETGATLAWSRNAPTKLADRALAVLASADEHGLGPNAYQLAALTAERDVLARKSTAERRQALAVFDVRLTAALMRLGRDVAVGRLEPQAVDRRWKAQRRMPNLAATLAASHNNVAAWLSTIQPRHPEYTALMRGLAELQAAQAKGGWPAVRGAAVKPGASHPLVPELRKRLASSGDLATAPVEGTRFDAPLENALRQFQEHHGLPPTGRVDPKTLAALNVPLEMRIRQVAVNLERWRWLPDDLGARHFRVNIPYFHLEAYEQGEVVFDIRAVVGKRGDETPIFSERMTHVVMSPYWNIPPKIATDETMPAVSADPDYLDRQNIEVVRVAGEHAAVVDPSTLDWDDEVALEGLRFRQRPGAGNALGFVKFMLPNKYDVYIHDTPAEALFSRLGRAFSHGCVRVEEPLELAKYVLRDQARWTPEAIETAMHGGTETHVKLREPIPVHILYFTSWVDTKGGLHFRDDVYGYDAKQDAATTSTKARRREGAKPNLKNDARRPRPEARTQPVEAGVPAS
jgi:L,D-transpeptidase YcbB